MSLPVFQPIVYGAHPGTIADFATTGGFTVVTPTGAGGATAVGVSDVLAGFAKAAGNTVTAAIESGTAVGDAFTVTDFVQAGHNTVTVTSFFPLAPNFAVGVFGDAMAMTNFAKGGGNTVTGSVLAAPEGAMPLYGDALTMSGFASGGGNTLKGVAGSSTLMFGDAQTMSDHARGGGNTLIGAGLDGAPAGSVTNTMFGDAQQMLGFASGGGNTLTAGQGSNDTMWGGAATVSSFARIAANTFVFNQGIGHDVIMDFRSGVDRIDLEGFGLSSFTQLEQLFHTTANGLDIIFSSSSSSDILLHGVSHVAAGDFVFT